jgi:uncharacterized protein YkuJ
MRTAASTNAKRRSQELKMSKDALRFHLFILIPEVQAKICTIREKLSIPKQGFASFSDADAWLEKNEYDFFRLGSPAFDDTSPNNLFFQEMQRLADTYHLPPSFLRSSRHGLAGYVTHNYLSVFEKNWEIIYDVKRPGQHHEWVGLRVFCPLTKKEEKEAMKELKAAQKKDLHQGLLRPIREKKNIEMDTQLLEFLAKRTGNPKRIKEYTSQYGERLEKSFKLSPSKKTREDLKNFEKENPHLVNVKYDQPLLSAFAKQYKKSADAVMKSFKRLDKMAFELYGTSIIRR